MKISSLTLTVFLLAGLALLCHFHYSSQTEEAERWERLPRFHEGILEVAKQEGIENVQEALFNLYVRAPYFSKAGAGTIHQDLYLSLDGKKNEVHLKNKAWVGLPATLSQTVFVVDGQVLEQLPEDAQFDRVTLVVFTPKVVQFIDYSRNNAGIYFRHPE